MENNIDKIFKEKLAEREFMPSDAHFGDLNARLDAKISFKKSLFFLFTSLFLAGLVFFLNGTVSTSSNSNNSLTFVEKENIKGEKIDLQKSQLESENNSAIKLSTNTKGKISLPTSEHLDQSDKNMSREKNLLVSTINDAQETRTLLNLENNIQRNTPTGFKNTNTGLNNTLISDKAKNDAVKLQADDALNPSADLPLADDDFSENQDNISTDTSSKFKLREYVKIDSLPYILEDIKSTKTPLETKTEDLVRPKRNEITLYEVQAEVGLINVPNYLNQIQIDNSPFIAPSIGVQLNRKQGKFRAGAGFNFMQFGDNQSFTLTEQEITISTADTSYWTYVQNGDSIFVTDTLVYTDTTVISNQYNLSNRYNYLQIPIQFGYVFYTQKWDFIPRASFIVGFAFGDKIGGYPNQDFTKVTENRIKDIALSYQLQLDVRRSFGRYYGVVSPRFGGNLSSLLKEYNSNAPNYFGVTVGIGISL